MMPKCVVHLLQIVEIGQKKTPSAWLITAELGNRQVESGSIGKARHLIGESKPLVLDFLCIAFDGDGTEVGAGFDHLFFKLGRPSMLAKIERKRP
ncbi:hypothetical protein GCM10023067_59550 [Aminobacter aganoensis]